MTIIPRQIKTFNRWVAKIVT